MKRTLKVTGKGKISVKPDLVRVLITQTHLEETYEGAMRESGEKKDALSAALSAVGFRKDALKTLAFRVDTEYEGYEAEDKSWKQRLTGYRYHHQMKLEFPADHAMLGKVLTAIAKCPGEPDISIYYAASDPESVKNELLAKAVEDAKKKANVLSMAAGVRLSEIVCINYSFDEADIVSVPMMNGKCRAAKASESTEMSLNLDVDDIDVTDTVTVVWEIA